MITVDEVVNHKELWSPIARALKEGRIKREDFYINSFRPDEVNLDFTASDGQPMFYYFYFDKRRNPNQITNENLIVGAKHCL